MCSKLAIKAVCDGVKFIPPQNKTRASFFFSGEIELFELVSLLLTSHTFNTPSSTLIFIPKYPKRAQVHHKWLGTL